MLLEVDNPRRASMSEFEGMIALSVPVRSNWELEDRTIDQGFEGVWIYEDDLVRTPVPVPVPIMEMQGDGGATYRRPIYRLRHEPTAPMNQIRRYRYLVRDWNSDVYVPRIDTAVYTLTEHHGEHGRSWEVATPDFTLWGVQP